MSNAVSIVLMMINQSVLVLCITASIGTENAIVKRMKRLNHCTLLVSLETLDDQLLDMHRGRGNGSG